MGIDLLNTKYQKQLAVILTDVDGKAVKLEDSGGVPVAVQDQTTDTLILPMVRQVGETTLASGIPLYSYTLEVTSAVGILVGQHLRIIDPSADTYYWGTVLSVVGNTITMDNQADHPYAAGSEVTFSDTNLAVDGSVTPKIFTLRTGAPSIPSDVDITRLIVVGECLSAVNLNKFGDLPALSRGLMLREVNGHTHNIFNVKSNAGIENITLDFKIYTATNPSQGRHGFSTRLTFSGQEKLGVVLRVTPLGNLEMVVQDDLTGLVSLKVILEGHKVQA